MIRRHDLAVLVDRAEDHEVGARAQRADLGHLERSEPARERKLGLVGHLLAAKDNDRMLLERRARLFICGVVRRDFGQRHAAQLGGKAWTPRDDLHRRAPVASIAQPSTRPTDPQGSPPLLARPAMIAGRACHLAAIACERGHRGEPMRCARTGRRPELSAASPARAAARPAPSRPGAGWPWGVRTGRNAANEGIPRWLSGKEFRGSKVEPIGPGPRLREGGPWVALGGRQMRLKSSRFRRSSALAVVGGCLGVYAVFAVGFHWFVEPTLGKNQGVAAYDPAPARVVPLAGAAAVPPARSEPASRLASKPAVSTKVRSTGPASTKAVRAEPPPRGAPPPMMPIVTKPAATETARSEPPSRAAPPPMMTAATKPAPGSTDTARSQPPSPVASEQATSDTIAAAEPTETPAAKKPHNKRKTVRRDRSRDFWNPLNFFAWGSANGARRAF